MNDFTRLPRASQRHSKWPIRMETASLATRTPPIALAPNSAPAPEAMNFLSLSVEGRTFSERADGRLLVNGQANAGNLLLIVQHDS